MNELDAVLRAIESVQATGKRAALATVVSVSGSAYRRPGARMLVGEDGTTAGGVSGGCLESDVVLNAATAIEDGSVTLASNDTTGDDDVDFGVGVGCHGVIHVLSEPLPARSVPDLGLLAALRQAHEPAVLATVWRASRGRDAGAGSGLLLDGCAIRWTDIGDSELARAIAGDAARALERRRSATTSYPSPTGDVEVLLEYLPPPVPLVVFGGGPRPCPSSFSEVVSHQKSPADRARGAPSLAPVLRLVCRSLAASGCRADVSVSRCRPMPSWIGRRVRRLSVRIRSVLSRQDSLHAMAR